MSETQEKPREFWVKIPCFDKVGMGDFRYSDAEISVDPMCVKNYQDFKNSIHAIEYSAYESLQKENEQLKAKLYGLKKALEKISRFRVGNLIDQFNAEVLGIDNPKARVNLESVKIAEEALKELEGEK